MNPMNPYEPHEWRSTVVYDTNEIIKGETYRVNKHIGRVNGDSMVNLRDSFQLWCAWFILPHQEARQEAGLCDKAEDGEC